MDADGKRGWDNCLELWVYGHLGRICSLTLGLLPEVTGADTWESTTVEIKFVYLGGYQHVGRRCHSGGVALRYTGHFKYLQH